MERIEDKIFQLALEQLRIKLTKCMYKRANLPHKCSLCLEEPVELGYKLKPIYRQIYEDYFEIETPIEYSPYLFICKECYEELPNGNV